jgi:DNA-binding transcriptional regulator YiaG
VNYQDEEREIDVQLRTEIRRLRETSEVPLETALNAKELNSLFKQLQVRKTVRKLPVSSYIRKVRTYVKASVAIFAAALNVSPDTIRQLETNESEPWTVPASAMADMMEVLRLHLNALETLTKNSHIVALLSRSLTGPDADLQSMATWLEEVRSELQRRGANDLVE